MRGLGQQRGLAKRGPGITVCSLTPRLASEPPKTVSSAGAPCTSGGGVPFMLASGAGTCGRMGAYTGTVWVHMPGRYMGAFTGFSQKRHSTGAPLSVLAKKSHNLASLTLLLWPKVVNYGEYLTPFCQNERF